MSRACNRQVLRCQIRQSVVHCAAVGGLFLGGGVKSKVFLTNCPTLLPLQNDNCDQRQRHARSWHTMLGEHL